LYHLISYLFLGLLYSKNLNLYLIIFLGIQVLLKKALRKKDQASSVSSFFAYFIYRNL